VKIPRTSPVVVVALDSGLILRKNQSGSFDELLVNLASATRNIARLVDAGCRVLVSHGEPVHHVRLCPDATFQPSGDAVESMPMDARCASWQGLIGYMLAQCLKNQLRLLRLKVHVCALVTQFEIRAADANDIQHLDRVSDPFESIPDIPSMPAGSMPGSEGHGHISGWRLAGLVEKPVVRNLVAGGSIVVCGTSGVAVQKDGEGYLKGSHVPINEHLAAARLAIDIKADALLLLIDRRASYLHHGDVGDQDLGMVTTVEVERYIARGRFSDEPMSSGVRAAVKLARTGRTAVITSPDDALEALAGRAGTSVLGHERTTAPRVRLPERLDPHARIADVITAG